jgi:GT2 family glycosyltransferase
MLHERFPQVRLIENSANVGFARANNQAIQDCSGEFVFLLNSDTIVQPCALSSLLAFARHSDASIVGADVRNADGSPQWSYGTFPSIGSEILYAVGVNSRRPFAHWLQPSVPPLPIGQETDWVLGAALVVRRSVLSQVGLLDEQYFMFSEEVDFARRVKNAGGKVYVLGGATIIHLGQQSTRQISGAMKAELFRSKVRYFRKHHGSAAALVLEVVFGVSVLARIAVFRMRSAPERERVWIAAWKRWRNVEKTRP